MSYRPGPRQPNRRYLSIAGAALFALALAPSAACKRGGDAEPEAVVPNPTPAEGSAEPDRTGELCQEAVARLTRQQEVVGPTIDATERSEFVRTAEPDALLAALPALAEAGASAREVLPALEERLGRGDLLVSDAIYATLPSISVDATLALAGRNAMNGDSQLAERYMASAALGGLGEPGIGRLIDLLRETSGEVERGVLLRGLSYGRKFPIAAREALFATLGYCNTPPVSEECLSMFRELSLVWEDVSPQNLAATALMRSEAASLIAGRATARWNEDFAIALRQDPGASLASLTRLQSLGPAVELVPAAIRAVTDPATAANARRDQTLWLLSLGAWLEPHADALVAGLTGVEDEPVAGLIGLAAFTAGRTDLPAATVAQIAALGEGSRTAIGWAAQIAAVRLLGADRYRAMTTDSLPDGFLELRNAAASGDVDALVAALLDERLPLGIAVDGAAVGAAGQREDFMAAMMDESVAGSARALEVAARGAAPSEELANKLLEFVDETSLSPSIAYWLAASNHGTTIGEIATRHLDSESSAMRRRAVQWANIAEIEVAREPLVAMVVAPASDRAVEHGDARALPMYRLLAAGPLELDEAVDVHARAAGNGVGVFEAAILLAAAHEAHCTGAEGAE